MPPTTGVRGAGGQRRRSVSPGTAVGVTLSVLFLFVGATWHIPTGAMESNLLIGDRIVVGPIRTIQRGDVLLFQPPLEETRPFIFRAIGLPGEKLEVRAKRVYINGVRLDEPYVHYLMPLDEEGGVDDVRVTFGPIDIPPDHYFMMGDNRDNANDSRYWGPLSRRAVRARVLLVAWSRGDGVRWDRTFLRVR